MSQDSQRVADLLDAVEAARQDATTAHHRLMDAVEALQDNLDGLRDPAATAARKHALERGMKAGMGTLSYAARLNSHDQKKLEDAGLEYIQKAASKALVTLEKTLGHKRY